MAMLKTIIPALRADISTGLRAISLGMFTDKPWRMRDEKERAAQPDIRELSGGVPRMWQLGEPTDAQQLTLGAPARKWEMVFPLEIIYPNNDAQWRVAAFDDIDRIYDYFTSHSTTTSGIDIREPVFARWPWTSEDLEDNNWRLITVPIWTVIEIS